MRIQSLCLFVVLSFSALSVCAEDKSKSAVPDDLFRAITSHQWDASTPGAFGSTHLLTLRKDGTYTWTRETDVSERNDAGAWNFGLNGKFTGQLNLTKSGDVSFSFTTGEPSKDSDDKFRVGGITFRRGKKIDYNDAESKLTVEDLLPVERREMTKRLASTAWVKANPFNNFYLPDRIELKENGTFSASFRDKACTATGIWGVLVENGKLQLESTTDPNDCDSRGGTAGLQHRDITFVGEYLQLGAAYAPEATKPKSSVFFFDQFGNSVQTRGEFSGKIEHDSPLEITFTHTSADGSPYALESIAIGWQSRAIVPGDDRIPAMIWGETIDLSGKMVTHGKPFSQKITTKPSFAGSGMMTIRFHYKSVRQPYHTDVNMFLNVLPKR